MTLGEKIKEGRKQCIFSQEQLAEKMSVSRSAVAKWETDKGLPDIDNLKLLSKTLNVSLDYLLDDGESMEQMVVRESYDINKYGKGSKTKIKDKIIKERFPDDEIYPLISKYKPNKKGYFFSFFLRTKSLRLPAKISYFQYSQSRAPLRSSTFFEGFMPIAARQSV